MSNIIVCEASELKQFFLELENRIIKSIETNLKKNFQQNEWLTIKEVCELLRISHTTLNEWSKNGLLNKHKIAGAVRYKSSEVNEALVKLEAKRSLK